MDNDTLLKVYVSALPHKTVGKALYPKERQDYVDRIKNQKQKQEAYFAWRLLEYAISKELNVDFNSLNFEIAKNGKWSCDACDFSISHGDGIVAVAIAKGSVGVDIEKIDSPKSNSFAARTLTEREFSEYTALDESRKNYYLIEKWTQKEAIFKSLNQPAFVPSEIDTSLFNTFTQKIGFSNGAEYYLSVSAVGQSAPIIEDVSKKTNNIF